MVKTRTKRLKNIFINTLCSRWQLFRILSDPAPVRTLFALNQVTQFIQFYHKQLHFFSINKTTIPTVITIIHKYLSTMLFTYFKQAIHPIKYILNLCQRFVFVYIVQKMTSFMTVKILSCVKCGF